MRLPLPLLLIPVIAACPGPETREPLAVQMEKFDQEMASLKSLVDAHAQEVAAQTSLSALPPLEEKYKEAAMTAAYQLKSLTLMFHAMCVNEQNQEPHTQDMTDVADLMQQACENHKITMDAATDLGAAKEEEIRHKQAITDLWEDLKALRDAFEPLVPTYFCDHTKPSQHDHQH